MNVFEATIQDTSNHTTQGFVNADIVLGRAPWQEEPVVATARCTSMRRDRDFGCVEGLVTLSVLDGFSPTPISYKRWVSVFIMNHQTAAERRELLMRQALHGFLREHRPNQSSGLLAA